MSNTNDPRQPLQAASALATVNSPQKPMAVIVYGPKACGKTRNGLYLRKAYGMRYIVDGWDCSQPITINALHLTNSIDGRKFPSDALVVSFTAAMAKAGAQ